MSANKTFYCPKCKRVYFLPANSTYLCNEERNFGLPPHEPWAIPEFVDYDAYARSLSMPLWRLRKSDESPSFLAA